jgi:beta-glucosidase
LVVTLKVKNTGKMAGKETVQIYVRDVESTVFRPEKELKGFVKVDLQPGEETEVQVVLNRRAFAYYDVETAGWRVESGAFEVLAGASSRDIRLRVDVEVVSSDTAVSGADRDKLAAYYHLAKGKPISQQDFAALLGRPLPPNEKDKKETYSINTPIGDMTDTFVGRQLHGMMKKQIAKMLTGQEDTPTALFMQSIVDEAPLRTMLMMSDGAMTRPMLDALLLMINGRFIKGTGALVKALRNK